MFQQKKILRLVMGDQLNIQHRWFITVDPTITYVMMEIRSETDYVKHHIQKVIGFFAAMRSFADELRARGHQLIYLELQDKANLHRFDGNIQQLIQQCHFTSFEYQLPDEYRVDQHLEQLKKSLSIPVTAVDTDHFFTTRDALQTFFNGKRSYVMESFYRHMRTKHTILMQGGKPFGGQWNYDIENRKSLPKQHRCIPPKLFDQDFRAIENMIREEGIVFMGTVDSAHFSWPINRVQSLELLDFFIEYCLPFFGTFQDAMSTQAWSLYHARLSFSLNCKLISPKEVIEQVIAAYHQRSDEISLPQVEGFVRQILGWREYMRGIYWMHMPSFAATNFFNHTASLPAWYWTGDTTMRCLNYSIKQSLEHAYAHHIQRLMVTGSFALLAGVDPDQVDLWYLGIYMDAIEWVEITNTRGMSQYADGGIVGTKPYVCSAAYISKMSDYCNGCTYDKNLKTGPKACPWNSLYWNFYDKHRALLQSNPRVSMMYRVWDKMDREQQQAILHQAQLYLRKIDQL